jgi:hypothetical protein
MPDTSGTSTIIGNDEFASRLTARVSEIERTDDGGVSVTLDESKESLAGGGFFGDVQATVVSSGSSQSVTLEGDDSTVTLDNPGERIRVRLRDAWLSVFGDANSPFFNSGAAPSNLSVALPEPEPQPSTSGSSTSSATTTPASTSGQSESSDTGPSTAVIGAVAAGVLALVLALGGGS